MRIKETIREFIKEDIDIDVYDDYNEELGIAFCGPVALTPEGEKRFEWVMNQEIEFALEDVAIVHAESSEEVELYKEFFLAAAGYCGEYAYRLYFAA